MFILLPLVVDERIFSVDTVNALVSLTLHRYAALDKRVQRVPIHLLRQILAQPKPSPRTNAAIIETVVKVLDQSILRSCTKYGASSVPQRSIAFALRFLDETIVSLGDEVPFRLFTVYCTLIGFLLSHGDTKPKYHPSFSKFFWSRVKNGKALANQFISWILEDKLSSNLIALHGGLASWAKIVKDLHLPYDVSWTPVLIKHLILSKLPVPTSVLVRNLPFLFSCKLVDRTSHFVGALCLH
jgi:hypothetical protein